MSIATKKGDRGMTSLLYGRRLSKDNVRIEAIGVLDELSSFLGLGKSLIKDGAIKKIIDRVQTGLLIIGSEVATVAKSLGKLKRRLGGEDLDFLDLAIEKLEKRYKDKSCFLLSGESTISAVLDVSRTLARKAERRIVSLKNREKIKNRHIMAYLNRLSDLLYLLARSYEKRTKRADYAIGRHKR